MIFTFYIVFHRFSSILNKVIQPEINAYCYVIETISRLCSAIKITHNNLIIFTLDCKNYNQYLAQQASEITTSNG